MQRTLATLLLFFYIEVVIMSKLLELDITVDTDPVITTRDSCLGKRRPCQNLLYPLIERKKSHLIGNPLIGWRYDEICQ
jgi:hypothetical protein